MLYRWEFLLVFYFDSRYGNLQHKMGSNKKNVKTLSARKDVFHFGRVNSVIKKFFLDFSYTHGRTCVYERYAPGLLHIVTRSTGYVPFVWCWKQLSHSSFGNQKILDTLLKTEQALTCARKWKIRHEKSESLLVRFWLLCLSFKFEIAKCFVPNFSYDWENPLWCRLFVTFTYTHNCSWSIPFNWKRKQYAHNDIYLSASTRRFWTLFYE